MSIEFKYVPLTFISTKEAIEAQLKNTVIFKNIAEKYNIYMALGELIHSTQYGFTASAKETGSHRLLRITDINNGSVNWNSVPLCECEREQNYLLSMGDILIARTGNNISYMVDEKVPFNAVFASYLIRIVCDKEKILPEYLYLFLNSYAFWPQILMKQRGALLQNVNANLMRQLLIPMCSINEQKELLDNFKTDLGQNIVIESKRISSLFNTKVSISTELSHQLTLVKKLRQQLLQDAVQGKLVPQNQNDEPASELLKKIKAEKAKLIAEKKLKKDPSTSLRAGKELPPIKPEEIPFKIPDNWVWCRLGEVVSHIFDGPFGSHLKSSDYKNSGVQVIRLQNLGFMKFKEDKESFVSIEKYNTIKQHTVYEGDIIIGSFLADGVNCVILPKLNYTAIAKADCFTIRISHLNVIKRFVIFLLSSEPMFKELSKLLRGMTRLRINTTQLKNLPIPLPPLAEQNRIVQKLDELMQYCNELEASIKESEMQNEKLLQQVLREALSLPRVTRGKEPIVE